MRGARASAWVMGLGIAACSGGALTPDDDAGGAGARRDATPVALSDAVIAVDAAFLGDTGVLVDAAVRIDAAVLPDAETLTDAMAPADAQTFADATALRDAEPLADAPPNPRPCRPVANPRPDVALLREGRFVRIRGLTSAYLPLPRDITVFVPANAPFEGADAPPVNVLYAHDGQNLFFDEESAFGASWGFIFTLDALVAAGQVPPTLVVGVHNTAARTDEYTPSVDPGRMQGGRADDYGRFIVEELKPLVDWHFSTQCGREHTGLMGSSFGGLASLHLRRRYPDVFGRVAAVSPSLWWNLGEPVSWGEELGAGLRAGERLWIDMGGAEGSSADDADADGRRLLVERARALAESADARAVGGAVVYREVPGAVHNERAWRDRLRDILRALWGEVATPEAARLEVLAYRDSVPRAGFAGLSVNAVDAADGRRTLLTRELSVAPLDGTLVWDPRGRLMGSDAAALPGGQPSAQAQVELNALGLSVAVPVQIGPEIAVTFEPRLPAAPADAATRLHITGSAAELGPWSPGARRASSGTVAEAGPLSVVVPILPGRFEYKYTLGDWPSVERTAAGADRPNRTLDVAGPRAPVRDEIDAFATP